MTCYTCHGHGAKCEILAMNHGGLFCGICLLEVFFCGILIDVSNLSGLEAKKLDDVSTPSVVQRLILHRKFSDNPGNFP